MMRTKSLLFISISIACILSITACKKEGPLEKAGSRVDEVVDNAKEGEPILKKKGPMEKTGEDIDKALHNDK
jgi:hypothetical protein